MTSRNSVQPAAGAQSARSDAGTLHVVATPIGNLSDMSTRACEVLGSVSLVAAEDSRHSQRLFNHFNIRCDCIPYHEHSEEKTAQKVINVLLSGEDVALISDAGTPLISDPGYRLIDQVQALGIRISPVPGPCALVAALSVSGLPTDSFLFNGFLPAKSAARLKKLQALEQAPHTLVFYEAPHRLLASLDDMLQVFGPERPAVLARELSKQYETVLRLPLQALRQAVADDSNQQRGECVVLVAGHSGEGGEQAARDVLLTLLQEGLPLKQAVKLAARLSAAKKNELYAWALEWQEAQ